MRRALKVIIGKLDDERFPEIGLESSRQSLELNFWEKSGA